MKNTSLLFPLVLVLTILAAVAAWRLTPVPKQTQSAPAQNIAGVNIGGPFELVTQDGKTVTEKDFAGQYLLIYFGYSFCPDVCPTSLYTMTGALDLLPETLARKIQPLFITVDPARDTPGHLKTYVELFSPRLAGLTGTAAQTAAAAKAWRVYFNKVENDESASDYLMDHSSYYYFMGPDGKALKIFGHDTTAEDMAETLKALMKEKAMTAPQVENAWARPTAPGMTAGAAYLTIRNPGTGADILTGVETTVAARPELHTHTEDNGVMRMRRVTQVDIPAGADVIFAPGGLHIMLMGLTAPLESGNTFPLTLIFEKAGRVPVAVTVRNAAGPKNPA